MRSKTMLACLMASALGLGLVACSDDDSGQNNNNTDLCGNGSVDIGEECDGDNFAGDSCTTLGMNGGTLTCTADCMVDLSTCAGCGNGVIEVGEICDGTDLDGQTCEDEGMISGTLACAADCNGYDTAGCDEPLNDCARDETLTLNVGEAMSVSVDTTVDDDTTDISCEEGAGANDHIYLITVDADGDLAVSYGGEWLIFAVYPEPANAIDCFDQGDEYGCYDAYFDGPTGVFSGLTAGNYYLVVSDYNTSGGEAADFFLTYYPTNSEICNNGVDDDGDGDVDCDDADCDTVAFCAAEDCSNGVDDNLDGLVDCMDYSCIGSTDCTGGVCTVDHDIGLVVGTTDATVTFDTTTASDDYTLACGTAGSPEYVISFTLDATSTVVLDLTQSAADANLVAFYFEGPAGNTCVDQEYFCFAPNNTAVAGLLTTNPLPPGTYFFITEVDNGGGPVTAQFSMELVCPAGQVEVGGVCVPKPCSATDLGTFNGTQIVVQDDSCTATADYFPTSVCTGWTADSEDMAYSLTVPVGTTINVTQAPINNSQQDSSLYVLDTCTDWAVSSCLAGSDTFDGVGPESLSYTNNTGADQVVYIVADAYGGCGEFELTIN